MSICYIVALIGGQIGKKEKLGLLYVSCHEIHQIDTYQIQTLNIKSKSFFRYPFRISMLEFGVIHLE